MLDFLNNYNEIYKVLNSSNVVTPKQYGEHLAKAGKNKKKRGKKK